jgi:hypothetical protein
VNNGGHCIVIAVKEEHTHIPGLGACIPENPVSIRYKLGFLFGDCESLIALLPV